VKCYSKLSNKKVFLWMKNMDEKIDSYKYEYYNNKINQIKIKAIKNEFIYLIVEFPRMCRMYV
jgi:hypothetical protein